MPNRIGGSPPPNPSLRVLTSSNEFNFQELVDFYNYCMKRRNGSSAPRPWEFDLLELTDLIHVISRVRVREESRGYQYVFVGQSLVNIMKSDVTGLHQSEIPDTPLAQRYQAMHTMILDSKKPVIDGERDQLSERSDSVQSLGVPLMENGEVKEIVVLVILTG